MAAIRAGGRWPLSVSFVSVRKRSERVRVDDAFVEDESVTFGRRDDSEMFGSWVSPEEVRVDHVNVTSFVERVGDFIDEVLTHDIVVELLGPTDVQGEPSHFAADFTLTSLVTVILGTRRGEFGDAVTILEFVGHLP